MSEPELQVFCDKRKDVLKKAIDLRADAFTDLNAAIILDGIVLGQSVLTTQYALTMNILGRVEAMVLNLELHSLTSATTYLTLKGFAEPLKDRLRGLEFLVQTQPVKAYVIRPPAPEDGEDKGFE